MLFVGLNAPMGAQGMTTTLVADGFTTPSQVVFPPGDPSRMFVLELATGKVKLVKNGVTQPTSFLELPNITGTDWLLGLYNMVFHPDYQTNGRFYVSYADDTLTTYIEEYTVSADPDIADPASGITIYGPLTQPLSDHNNGGLAFGPDGMLWIGMGDGGGPWDPNNLAQNLTTTFGKLLRLDVENPPSYIPADNPYIGAPFDPTDVIPDEIWAIGFRNPWRISFDQTGELYIGDVGQRTREEISVQPTGSTGRENYGWRCKEGNVCTQLTGCSCTDPTLVPAIHDYPRPLDDCSSITGGHVYRGSAIAELQGHYVFGDYCTGQIWSLRYTGGVVSEFTERTAELDPPGPLTIDSIVSFAEDPAGELYIVCIDQGQVFRIDPLYPSFCDASDGALASCPCANPGAPTSGCDISQSTGGISFSVTSQQTSPLNRATLAGAGYPPPSTPGVTVIRASAADPAAPIVFGDGLRCIGTPVVRVGSTLASGGTSLQTIGHGAMAGAGTFYYQLWLRNTPIMFCDPTAAFNLSNGRTITW
jgi:hypothetical protein